MKTGFFCRFLYIWGCKSSPVHFLPTQCKYVLTTGLTTCLTTGLTTGLTTCLTTSLTTGSKTTIYGLSMANFGLSLIYIILSMVHLWSIYCLSMVFILSIYGLYFVYLCPIYGPSMFYLDLFLPISI